MRSPRLGFRLAGAEDKVKPRGRKCPENESFGGTDLNSLLRGQDILLRYTHQPTCSRWTDWKVGVSRTRMSALAVRYQ